MDTYTKWELVLKQYLNKTFYRHLFRIFLSMEVVNQNIKPAFLWDIGQLIDSRILTKIVNNLKYNNLLQPDIYVVCFAQEYAIVNIKQVLIQAKRMLYVPSSHYFIDVSKSLKKPYILNSGTDARININKMMSQIIVQMENFLLTRETSALRFEEPTLLQLHMEASWCVPTLIGIFLGYPVVYWYNGNSSDGETCLNLIPLTVYKIKTRMEVLSNRSAYEVYSFSVPCNILPIVVSDIDQWFDKIVKCCFLTKMFVDVYKECKTVKLSNVIL